MIASFSDMLLSVAYLMAWVTTFFYYQKKRNVLDGGSVIILSYVCYSVFSIITLNDELFSVLFEPLRLFPYIYLYIMLLLALSPTIYHHLNPVNEIIDPQTRILKATALLTIISSFLLLPEIILNFNDGLVALFTDVDAGQEMYRESLSQTDEAGKAISNLPAIITNAFADITIFLFLYYLSKREGNTLLILGLGFAIIISLLTPVMHGQRSRVVIRFMTLIMGFFLFKDFYSQRVKTYARNIGIVVIAVMSLPVAAITVSRFGERMAGVWGYINWYVGQENLYFNNYGLDAGGVRYGDRTLNLLKRVIDPSTPANFMERRDKYHNLEIDDYNFYTFVGDFTIDYGPILAVIIFVVFNAFVLRMIRRTDNKIKLHQLLLLYFTMCVCMQGGMVLFMYSDTAGLQILTLMFLYIYLWYHEKLLEKFPMRREGADVQQISN